MTISDNVSEADWSVSTEVNQTAGGYGCRIRVKHGMPEGVFTHEFRHSRIFATEREVVLEGLRDGMVWFELKRAKTFHV
ncbi:UDP-glucose 4-epimerase [Paraburkholderia sediminicola]|uniref:UDP-glucose 4-epimerase n=1 Tax=Paraburkholderia sediminicola TaxID=458836 RepID=UPI0038BDDEFF